MNAPAKLKFVKAFIVTALIAAAAAPAAAGFLDALTGALSWTVELAALLAEKQPRLKELYIARFGAAGPAGTLHPNLTINADGSVAAVAMESDGIGDAAFASAVQNEIKTWQMPKTTWSMTLGFDLEFDPSRGVYGVEVN